MSLHRSARHALAAVVLAMMAGGPVHLHGQSPLPVELAARTAVRNETARSLVPLLKDLRRQAKGGVTVQPGTVPDSPFTGTQTTLFAFTLSKRSVPVAPEVIKAMDQLLAWKIGEPGAPETAELFDEWLNQLSIKSASFATTSGVVLCDASCIVKHMTTLDESWDTSPRNRAELRDQALLDALVAAVSH